MYKHGAIREERKIELTNSDRTYGDSTHGVLRVGSRTLMVQEKGAAKLACSVADVNPEGTFGRVCAPAL